MRDAVRDLVDPQFAALNGRVDALDGKFGMLDRKTDLVNKKVDIVNRQVDLTFNMANDTKTRVQALERKLDKLGEVLTEWMKYVGGPAMFVSAFLLPRRAAESAVVRAPRLPIWTRPSATPTVSISERACGTCR